MGEMAAFAQVLTHTGIWKTIAEQVRFARARFGHYDLIDFVAVLIGYIISGEPTLQAFYERLAPFGREPGFWSLMWMAPDKGYGKDSFPGQPYEPLNP
jgi:hypothetical protein